MLVGGLASKRLRCRFLGGLLCSLGSFIHLVMRAVTSTPATTASPAPICSLRPSIPSLATLGHLVLDREIVSEIDAFFVHDLGCLRLLLLLLFALIVESKAEKAVGVDLAQVFLLVDQVQVHLYLTFSPERYIAFRFALFVRAQVVRLGKVDLKRVVIFVKPIFLEVAAQIAGQVQLVQMLLEALYVVEELLAEIAPGMGKDLSSSLGGIVTVLDV